MPEILDSTPAKANATPMVDDHPGHHNDITSAVNAIDVRLAAIEAAIPIDGETGESLVMASNDDRDTEWVKLKVIPSNPGTGWSGKILAATSETAWGWTELSSMDDVVLPSQTGNNGKFLKTNGSNASWGWPLGSNPASVTGTRYLKNVGGTMSWGTLAPGTMPNEEDASDNDVIRYSAADGIHWGPETTEIPSLSGVTIGWVLKKTDVDSYDWAEDQILPDASGADIGDVLTNLGPGPGWAAPSGGLPSGTNAGDTIYFDGTDWQAGHNVTTSTSTASGTPADGDVWMKYTP